VNSLKPLGECYVELLKYGRLRSRYWDGGQTPAFWRSAAVGRLESFTYRHSQLTEAFVFLGSGPKAVPRPSDIIGSNITGFIRPWQAVKREKENENSF
jgi:hypothetical protein